MWCENVGEEVWNVTKCLEKWEKNEYVKTIEASTFARHILSGYFLD